jgi:two-component system, chemotaxis family, response regulator PixG
LQNTYGIDGGQVIQTYELKGETHSSLQISQLIDQYLQTFQKGYLQINAGLVTWFIYIDHGKLLYVTHSIDPVDRLDCHLRGLNRRIPELNQGVRAQIRLSLELQLDLGSYPRQDYQGIGSLVQDSILSAEAAQALILSMSQEALESLLVIQESNYTFVPNEQIYGIAQPLDYERLLSDCQQRIQAWKSLSPHISSPYQRPYLFSQSQSPKLTPDRQQRLGKLLKGFSFRQLAIMLDQDELKLARSLYPLIVEKAILLREPQVPYGDLPHFSSQHTDNAEVEPVSTEPSSAIVLSDAGGSIDAIPQLSTPTQTYRVTCIDDSPAMLQTIEKFLGHESLSVSLIQDSLKALVELMRIKPNLILLDVGMPKVDGYELCRLLRKHPLFKNTPIIMVTAHTGLIDRARAKIAGTTDYMTKPFTQDQLLKMVFRYLT